MDIFRSHYENTHHALAASIPLRQYHAGIRQVQYLKTINSDLADVVTLGFQGFDKKDVVKQLPVKSSQAYDLYAKAEKLTREFLFK